MLSSDPPINGFTTWPAEGHGESFKTATNAERVRGRIERTVFVTILDRSRAAELMAEVSRKVPISHMIYWIEPVSEFRRMTKERLD